MGQTTISGVFSNFLDSRKEVLSQKTYKLYDRIIKEFENYLNENSHKNINNDELVLVDNLEDEGKLFTEVFDFSKVEIGDFENFISEYLSKKRYIGITIVNGSPRVLKKFVVWCNENKLIPTAKKDFILSKLNEYSKIINKITKFEKKLKKIVNKHSDTDSSDEINGIFVIDKLDDNILILQDFFNTGVTYKVKLSTELNVENYQGWNVSGKLVRNEKGFWDIVLIDKIFPAN